MTQSDDTNHSAYPDPSTGTVNVSRPGGSPDYVPGSGNGGGGSRPVRPPTEKRASEQRLTTAAEGSVLPHIYGKVQIGGKVFAVGHDTSYWYIGVAWCIGGTRGISEIEKVFNGETEVPASDRQDYPGWYGQDTFYGNVAGGEELYTSGFSDNWLRTSIGAEYADKMVAEIMDRGVGVAYSILRIALKSSIGNIVGQINGILVKDYSSANVPDTTQPVAEPIDLVNFWVDYDDSWFGKARYFEVDGAVFVQGLVRWAADGRHPVSILPKHIAPEYPIVHSVYTNNETARCDIRSDGSLVSPWDSANGGFSTTWASITFDYCYEKEGWVPLTLLNGWTKYPASAGYPELAYKIMGDGRVYLRGLIIPGSMDVEFAQLPAQLAPPANLMFSCRTQGDSDSRVDLDAYGKIISRNSSGWLAVSFCYYPDDDGWTDLTLINGYQNYGGGWQTAQYKKLPSGIVAVRGLVTNTSHATDMAVLPSDSRPSGTLLTAKICGDSLGNRVDYAKDGKIKAINANTDVNFVSITQVFVASNEMWAYVDSTNPSNALADHIESKAYGVGGTIGSVETTTQCADYNNEFVIVDDSVAAGTAPNDTLRHEIGYAMTRIDDVTKYVEVLRNYANCFVQYFGTAVYMIPDRKIAGSGTDGGLTTADFSIVFDDSNVVRDSIKLKKAGDRNHPTVVRVSYSERTPASDTAINLWSDGSVVKYYNDDISDVSHWKEARLSFPGIPTKSQATRKAIEYMNHLWLEDLDVQFETFGEAITLYNGSPFLLKHYLGIGTDLQEIDGYKPFRCVNCVLIGPNKYRVYGKEYQPDAYSDVIDITPSIPDTNLPDPTKPIEITGLSVTERSVYNGSRYYTVFDVVISVDENNPRKNWQSYTWQLLERGLVVDKGTQLDDLTFTTRDLTPDTSYTITVTATNVTSAKTGIPFVTTAYAFGKDAPPSEPKNLTAEEYGESIFLEWDDADDEFPVRKYEVRKLYNPIQFMPTNGEEAEDQWKIADVENKVGASGYVKTGALKGTYRFFVKAIDVFGTYSTYPAYVEVNVTSDNSSFVRDRWQYKITYQSNGMYLYKPKRNNDYTIAFNCAVTSFSALFTNNLSTYGSRLFLYYPDGYDMNISGYLRLGDPARNSADLWPIVMAAKLTGSFESVLEEFENPDYYLGGTLENGWNLAVQVTNESTLSEGGVDKYHYPYSPNTPFVDTAKSIRLYTGNKGVIRFRADNAYVKASFIPKKENGVISTIVGNGATDNVVELEGNYYAAYKINTQVFINNSSLTHGADNVSVMSEPFHVDDKADIATNNAASKITSTSTDFVAAGFTVANENNPDVTNFIRLTMGGATSASGLYKLVSVSTNELVVSPAPPTEAAGNLTSITMVNTITLYCRNYILGHEVAREVHWFFEGV